MQSKDGKCTRISVGAFKLLPCRPTRYALGAIFLWATQALVLARELPHLNIYVFLTLSFLFSGIILSIRILPQIIRFAPLVGDKSFRSDLRKVRRALAERYFLAGVAFFFLYHFLLFHALNIGPVVTANLFNFLWPILFVILAERYFPNEKPAGNESFLLHIKITIGFLGCVLLFTRGGGIEISKNNILGPCLGAFAAATWAIYTLILKKHHEQKRKNCLRFWRVCYAFGAAAISFIILFLSENFVVPDLSEWQKAFLPALYFGVGPLGLAMIWYDKAVKDTQAEKLGRLTFLTPLISTILLLYFAKTETLNLWGYLGVALIVIANMSLRHIWFSAVFEERYLLSRHRQFTRSQVTKRRLYPLLCAYRAQKIFRGMKKGSNGVMDSKKNGSGSNSNLNDSPDLTQMPKLTVADIQAGANGEEASLKSRNQTFSPVGFSRVSDLIKSNPPSET
jgi:drug/metabolite transporter (DMT)-like permease